MKELQYSEGAAYRRISAMRLSRRDETCVEKIETGQGTGKRCDAEHFLEIDHIVPFALGGKTEASNLRVLCRTHNQLAAEEAGAS